MAKHKKKRPKYVSKGERPNVTSNTIRVSRDVGSGADKAMNKLNAWIRGKKGNVTVPNPNAANETDKPFIKVSFDRYFGGTYKDIKSRFKRTEDRVEA